MISLYSPGLWKKIHKNDIINFNRRRVEMSRILSGDQKKTENGDRNAHRLDIESFDKEREMDVMVVNEDNTNTGMNQSKITNLE